MTGGYFDQKLGNRNILIYPKIDPNEYLNSDLKSKIEENHEKISGIVDKIRNKNDKSQ